MQYDRVVNATEGQKSIFGADLVDDGQLTFEVSDDGHGFDSASTPLGSGTQDMADRLAALGGSIEIRSQPGSGTTVRGRVPVVT